MKTGSFGFVADGEQRTREAVNAQVRGEYQKQLITARDFWQRVAMEKKIYREVRERMKRIASPYSLWISP